MWKVKRLMIFIKKIFTCLVKSHPQVSHKIDNIIIFFKSIHFWVSWLLRHTLLALCTASASDHLFSTERDSISDSAFYAYLGVRLKKLNFFNKKNQLREACHYILITGLAPDHARTKYGMDLGKVFNSLGRVIWFMYPRENQQQITI